MKPVLIAALCAFALGAAQVAAKDPPPFKDFSAKWVKPPAPGTRKRITIQIDPPPAEEPAPRSQASGDKERPTVPKTRYGWFWQSVSPDMIDANPGRLEDAMLALAKADVPVAAPRLDDLRRISQAQGRDILFATVGTNVSPALALAVIWAESAGRADALSSAGAQGIMQLMPATAERFGVTDPLVPAQNIKGGVKYLNWLMREFDRDPMLVLAGYNAGEGAVKKHQGVPPYAETRDYVPKVLAAFRIARGLCLTPPELISDGCVFVGMNGS